MAAMPQSMSFDSAGKTFVAVMGPRTVSASDWSAFVTELDARLSELRGVLMFSAGASIDIREREQLEHLLTLGRLRVAVLTDSKALRGAATALSWFKIPIKSFGPNDVEPALAHLRVEKAERARVYTALAQLKIQVIGQYGLG
jgi:hypothetical protein